MRRPRAVISVALALVALVAIVVGGIALAGSGDDGGTTTSPAPAEAPSGATPPSSGALPPELLECLGVESPNEIHSAPPQVVEECFGALHQGGG